MNEVIAKTGIPSAQELNACPGIPTAERMARGPVAHIECCQCIPCDPCQRACPNGAISIGSHMTDKPVLDGEKCVGCGECIAKCPGLAITVVNMAAGEGLATLDFPYEYLPLPKAGDVVSAADRAGNPVCPARVLNVFGGVQGTRVIRIEFPAELAERVKTIKRLPREAL